MKAKKFSLGLLVPPGESDESSREGIAIIVLTDGGLKTRLAFYMAANAVQSGKEASMLFSLKGLKSIQKPAFQAGRGSADGGGSMRRGFRDTVFPLYLSSESSARRAFMRMLNKQGLKPLPQIYKVSTQVGLEKLPSLPEAYDWAVDAGVVMLPCQYSMKRFHIHASSLREDVSPPTSAAAFLREAACSRLIFLV